MGSKEIIPSSECAVYFRERNSISANRKGELHVIIDGQAIPLKRLNLISQSHAGRVDINGTFLLWDDLTAEERASFCRLWGSQGEPRYFKININFIDDNDEEHVIEPALKCKVVTDTLGQAWLDTVYSFLTAAADI